MPTFLERYLAGEHETVWTDLVALGPGVRHDFYLADAQAVARETMRRVRHNLDLLFTRLHELGYEFQSGRRELEDRVRQMEATLDRSRSPLQNVIMPGLNGGTPHLRSERRERRDERRDASSPVLP